MLIEKFDTKQQINSFDYIENFIASKVSDWSSAPDTAAIEKEFSNNIQNMDDETFAFLLLHSGYIPESYLPDSSQETLYSKLIESLVCEWAKRVGFSDSYLQTQKSNKEDVTIKDDNNIIVCDAKSFRLGRSQAAPNVKDTIKKSAYSTWLEQYKTANKIGGIVTFPSLHDWQKGSEAYSYFTEGNPPIMLIFYEQMAYMLLKKIKATDIISFLNSYATTYPSPSKEKQKYWKGFNDYFFKNHTDYKPFMTEAKIIIKARVKHTVQKIQDYLNATLKEITEEIEQIPIEQLKQEAIKAKYNVKCKKLEQQIENIRKFRPYQ